MTTYSVAAKYDNSFVPVHGAEYYQQGAADAKARELSNKGRTVQVWKHEGTDTEVCYELTGK